MLRYEFTAVHLFGHWIRRWYVCGDQRLSILSLVVEDTAYNQKVPVLIGTNVLKSTLTGLSEKQGVRLASDN